MARSLRNSGLLLFAGLIAVYIANSLVVIGPLREHLTNALFLQVAGLCVVMVAAGLVLPMLTGAAGAVAGRRCARCGKRVEKNALYCRDHQKLAMEELRDKQRDADHTAFSGRKR